MGTGIRLLEKTISEGGTMKVWRLIITGADGRGSGEQFQDRWRAEEAYEAAREPGVVVTLTEVIDGRQIEIVRDSRFEEKVK